MTPYYQDDLVTIYLGDAHEWTTPVDVMVTDPPYGVGLSAVSESGYRGAENRTRRVVRDPYPDDPTMVRALIVGVIPGLIALANRALIFP